MVVTFEDDEAYQLFLILDSNARIQGGGNSTVNHLRERVLPIYREWHAANPGQVHPGLAHTNGERA